MPVFSNLDDVDAHRRYVNWIDANPNGFVLNRKGPQDMVLHTASCGHFKPYNSANQTNNLKACSLDRMKLEHWAEVEGVDKLQLCNDCM
ncbi:MAG: hypothetical protein QOE77_3031 [Blastocatellia bacterium]|jgi:hypothetical protein|nr:hypothetical protein [Blastocatellia bacterium]